MSTATLPRNHTDTRILVDLYLRLSDGRNENRSFEERELALRERAERLGWTVRRTVRENDLMNGAVSASAFKRRRITMPDGTVKMRVWRPGFRAMLDDLQTRQINAVLAEDLDRVLRDPRDGEDLIDVVQATHANVDSLSGSLRLTDGGTDSEITQARLLIAFAWKSSRDTARRVRDGRKRTAGRGGWGGGRRPYGFTPTPHPSGNHRNTVLVIDEAEAEEIRWAAGLVLNTNPMVSSLRAIARNMRERGVATVTGTQWTARTLRDVLLRRINAGIVQYDDEETETRLSGDPILHEDVWRAVTEKLTDPSRITAAGRAPCWLGTNLYRCICGSMMEIHRGVERTPAYRCARKGGSDNLHVRCDARRLDDFVASRVIARMSMPDAAELFTGPPAPGVDLAALRRQVKALTARKASLSAMLGAGDMDEAEFRAASRANKAKLDAAESALSAARPASADVIGPLVGVADVAAAWEALTLNQKRAIVGRLMTVTILPVTVSRWAAVYELVPCNTCEALQGEPCWKGDPEGDVRPKAKYPHLSRRRAAEQIEPGVTSPVESTLDATSIQIVGADGVPWPG